MIKDVRKVYNSSYSYGKVPKEVKTGNEGSFHKTVVQNLSKKLQLQILKDEFGAEKQEIDIRYIFYPPLSPLSNLLLLIILLLDQYY